MFATSEWWLPACHFRRALVHNVSVPHGLINRLHDLRLCACAGAWPHSNFHLRRHQLNCLSSWICSRFAKYLACLRCPLFHNAKGKVEVPHPTSNLRSKLQKRRGTEQTANQNRWKRTEIGSATKEHFQRPVLSDQAIRICECV